MPSLRKRVSSYFRQLSFYNEPRDKKNNINENSFITKYLEGFIHIRDGPPILYGKNPTDLPNYNLAPYDTGPDTLIGCYSGPNGGLTTVKRLEKHLSIPDTDIDYIDIQDEPEVPVSNSLVVEKSPQKTVVDNMTMLIKVAGQEYLVTNRKKADNKSHSLASLTDIDVEVEKTKKCANNNNEDVQCRNQESDKNLNETQIKVENKSLTLPSDKKVKIQDKGSQDARRNSRKSNVHHNLSKSKSEGNPFQHKKKGKIIKLANRPTNNVAQTTNSNNVEPSDSKLPNVWNRSTDHVYGISDSLYDTNQVTKTKNGDPIADCFGIIARNDSAILAVADGVNWGEKASVAAKSAIHGCLHYLNKTIFNDTKSFDDLITTNNQKPPSALNYNRITNTREVFVCLLRAFHCAHDLILENEGMLTTLTVAVILPLNRRHIRDGRPKSDTQENESYESYVCCVCNVGDTLAYIYSQNYGVRELTKGSHDINCNRDMRDALGALGPVDGINPELSNLTLSITIVQKGDIILVASDGLTDNFDSNVCKFTVNTKDTTTKSKRPSTASNVDSRPKWDSKASDDKRSEAPVKPPRKHKDTASRSSRERSVDSLKGKLTADSSCQTLDEAKSNVVEPVPNIKDKSNEEHELDNPLVAQFLRENSLNENDNFTKTKMVLQSQPSTEIKRKTSTSKQSSSHLTTSKSSISKPHHHHQDKSHVVNKPSSKNVTQVTSRQTELRRSTSRGRDLPTNTAKANTGGFLRSKTSLDMRTNKKTIVRNEDGVPFVTPLQRYEISLLLMEDVLKHGISGHDLQCSTARKVCENLVNFTYSISAAKRHTLEDSDLYFDNVNGVLVEVCQHEKKLRRRRGLERVQNLPGKLDHVTVVAYNVGNFASMF